MSIGWITNGRILREPIVIGSDESDREQIEVHTSAAHKTDGDRSVMLLARILVRYVALYRRLQTERMQFACGVEAQIIADYWTTSRFGFLWQYASTYDDP